MKNEIEIIIMTAVLEMAKKRQETVNHLEVGNYVAEHYNKILNSLYPKMTIEQKIDVSSEKYKSHLG